VACGRGVCIAPGARLRNAVIWDRAVLGPRAVVEDAVVAAGVQANGPVRYMALRADRLPDADLHDVLARLSWPPAATTVLPLPPRGSARSFTRLRFGTRTVMVVRYSLERPENGLYAGHARFLAGLGVRVPAVLLDLPERHVAVFEDAGDVTLDATAACTPPARLRRIYARVLGEMTRLHYRGGPAARRRRLPLAPPFGPRLYRWEEDLFMREFLVRNLHVDEPATAAIRREFAVVRRALAPLPPVLLHRDLQSSNILLRRGRPVLLDFQGMRYGPALYDLASLLCDPYVELAPELQESLLTYAVRIAPRGALNPEVFWPAAVQRLAQALGAYGRLSADPATRQFSRYFAPGMRMMLRALDRVAGFPRLRAVLADALSGRYKRRNSLDPSVSP
jgi:aminoglycoside/choline kinase family phosphotransferase